MLRRLIALPFALAGLSLAGCGGGGGGGTYTFAYSTDWTNYAGASGGQSERVQLFTAAGALVNSVVLNQGSGTVSKAPFASLPAGQYHLEVQLFSSVNAAGSEVGDFDLSFDVAQLKSLETGVGDQVAKLGVTPVSATVNVQQSQQFYVGGYTASGEATFVATGSIAWSVLGGVGTVDPAAGLFLATTPGTGSVQASQASTGLNAAATVKVNSVQTQHGTWTIMVYMNAANDLSADSLVNFTQMQSVAKSGTAVRTLVQWKQASSLPYPAQFNGTRRYLILPSQSTGIASQLVQDMGTGVDMGSPTTMATFIAWCKTYYPADHYLLVVWDHGAGWQRGEESKGTRAVSFDDEFGTVIQTWQLSQAIGGAHLDILAWDASLMQMAEVADEIRGQVDYVAGSEESPPAAGYPYNLVFAPFYDTPNETPLQLSESFVTGMVNGYAQDADFKITQSVLDTSKLPAVYTAINAWGTALLSNVGSLTADVQSARTNAQSYSLSGTRYYFDMSDLATKLDAGTTAPAVLAADAQVRAAIAQAVVWEGHNSASPGSHGLAIDFSPASVFVSYAQDYAQLRMATDTNWAQWLTVAP